MQSLRDGFLGSIYNFTHRHYFDEGVSAAERSQWLSDVQQMADEAGITLVHTQTSDGFELGFADEAQWTAFLLNLEGIGGESAQCGHTHRFNGHEIQTEWTYLAQDWLDRLGVPYRVEQRDGEVRFAFNSIEDRTVFHSLVEDLDYAADALSRANALRTGLAQRHTAENTQG